MMKLKIITGDTLRRLEESVNQWMSNSSYEIHSHSVTFNPVAKPGDIDRYVMAIMYLDRGY